MQIRFNVTGTERKKLAVAVAEITGAQVKYKGAPTFAYEVDCFMIDKAGTITVDGFVDSEEIESLVTRLNEKGFQAQASDEQVQLCIELPRTELPDKALETLRQLVQSKAQLIKSALGTENLVIEVKEDRIRFPWFTEISDPGDVKAYTQFITALCNMAKTLKRVNAVDRSPENEKYAFRCFLLRLGFIGREYKETRRVLLSRLSGNTAFRDKQQGGDSDE